jgi:hypothetical protein
MMRLVARTPTLMSINNGLLTKVPQRGLVQVGFWELASIAASSSWLLKNSFQAVSTTTGAGKSLNVRSPHALKFIEITALVPFLTAIAPESPTKPGK